MATPCTRRAAGRGETRFREAEQMQAEAARRPMLDTWPGFRYGELLLAAPERAAWGGWDRASEWMTRRIL